MAGPDIPAVDLTGPVMEKVRALKTTGQNPAGQKPVNIRRKQTWSLLQDLAAAAAASVIIFWMSGPVFTYSNLSLKMDEVARVSGSVGGIFQSYVDFSSSVFHKLSDSLIYPARFNDDNRRGPGKVKGDERFEM